MQYLRTYLDKITERGNAKLAESISRTADEVGSKYIQTFSWMSHEIGLLFGNVQSGKTGQMFGIICKAADIGFPAFVLLTTDNVVLQQQTLERVRSDLDGFCICGENDSGIFIENNLIKPAIVVLKKNSRMLRLWANVFNTTAFMRGNPLFIVDDEADAASLNTMVNRDKQSSINRYLDSIKKGASSSMYLQVTGTPQAIFLQTMLSGWHPYFTYYFRPGDGYLGGDFFFPTSGVPECIHYLTGTSDEVRNVVIRHLAASAQILSSGGKVSNCLFHPSVRQAEHQRFADAVSKSVRWCKEHIDDEMVALLDNAYATLTPVKTEKQPLDVIRNCARDLLQSDDCTVLVMNGANSVDSTQYSTGCNFVIGGNTLGRGVTFPGLQTIYYVRSSKKPQADTMWQHSRMFGYDRDAGLMRVYIDERLYKLFADINATNNSIIAQVEKGLEDIKVFYPEGLNPTRKNVLDNKHVGIISGGTNYYPFNPGNDSIETISAMLAPFTDETGSYQVNLHLIEQILQHIIPSEDFPLGAFTSVIKMLLAETPAGQGILIVRRNRNVAQGTGALLSPNDWHLGGTFSNNVVLTMYQVTGTKGWGGKALWVPNIKLPHNTVYYDVDDAPAVAEED